MNKLTITGYLGRDPESRYTPTGRLVTSFPVATNRKYTRSDGEKVTDTVWCYVSAWGRLGEIANEYLVKGSHVLIEGRLKEPYVSKEGRASNQADATYLEMLDRRDRRSDEGEQEDEGEPVPVADEDEFPF